MWKTWNMWKMWNLWNMRNMWNLWKMENRLRCRVLNTKCHLSCLKRLAREGCKLRALLLG